MADPFIGQIVMFGGNFAPRGWALCDGQLLPISSHSALFSILGTTYGGDGRTTFGLPDLRGRYAMHAGNGPGLSGRNLGAKSGTETNTLNVTQIPSHNHTAAITDPAVTVNVGASTTQATSQTPSNGNVLSAGTAAGRPEASIYGAGSTDVTLGGTSGSISDAAITVGNTGNNQSVNNMPPFQCVNFIIALQGTFPSRN